MTVNNINILNTRRLRNHQLNDGVAVFAKKKKNWEPAASCSLSHCFMIHFMMAYLLSSQDFFVLELSFHTSRRMEWPVTRKYQDIELKSI